ncbi:MAG TPA: glutamate racemase [Syntrophorhabdales bacterium]|nr:glutamate racemase [Syntrophorhabdales bacterium]
MQNLAIGMFDSGIGGLTVFKEVRDLLPKENIIYLGDTARVPYGNKSPYTVTRYALETALFLLAKGIKALVIACNTSSALSLTILKRKLPIPVIGVIDPAASAAVRQTRSKKVGVIGTKATVKSMAYERAVRRIDRHVQVFSQACPLFVPIVEEGWENSDVAHLVVRQYLTAFHDSGIDVLVMGCTHYPILQPTIREEIGSDVFIVNTGRETAAQVQDLLSARGLLRESGTGGVSYFVTDSPDTFSEIGSRFLGETVRGVKLVKNLDLKDFLLST